jgi:hypothetical protein
VGALCAERLLPCWLIDTERLEGLEPLLEGVDVGGGEDAGGVALATGAEGATPEAELPVVAGLVTALEPVEPTFGAAL